MKVKIDTKQQMHVITVKELKLPANMTEGIQELLLNFLSDTIKNIIVNFEEVNEIELMPARALLSIQQKFYEDNHSMVFCNLKPAVTDFLDKMDLLETMNITPTESEAWDIVQMEEIERELLES